MPQLGDQKITGRHDDMKTFRFSDVFAKLIGSDGKEIDLGKGYAVTAPEPLSAEQRKARFSPPATVYLALHSSSWPLALDQLDLTALAVLEADPYWCFGHWASVICLERFGVLPRHDDPQQLLEELADLRYEQTCAEYVLRAEADMTARLQLNPLWETWARENYPHWTETLYRATRVNPSPAVKELAMMRTFLTMMRERFNLRGCCLLGDETMTTIQRKLRSNCGIGHDCPSSDEL